jgi:hypothetical protein
MDRDKEQMRDCLREIREKAATMKNGGAWAAGMAALCLGTLSVPNQEEQNDRN